MGARFWAWLWHGPQFRSWTEHVQIWGASEPQITPLALPEVKPLKAQIAKPVKAKRQKPDNVTQMRQRQG